MTPIERLRALARETLRQYGTETAAGGEPAYPAWVDGVTAVCDELERLRADAAGLMPQKAEPSDADLTALGQSVGLGPSLSVEFGRALLARYGQPAASAEPKNAVTVSQLEILFESEDVDRQQPGYHWRKGWNAALRRCMDIAYPMYVAPVAAQAPAASAEPVAWVAADTLNSPHPGCVSSLAYVSQSDKDQGREYVPLYAAPTPPAPSGVWMRALRLADDSAESLICTEGHNTEGRQWVLYPEQIASDPYLEDCIAHLEWRGIARRFDAEGGVTVIFEEQRR